MSNKTIYGFVNVGTSFEGESINDIDGRTRWYLTREERNAALERTRSRAIAQGLSPQMARAGIYPVKRRNPSTDLYEATRLESRS